MCPVNLLMRTHHIGSSCIICQYCESTVSEYCFTSLSAQSWQYRDRRKPEAGTMPYSYFEWLQGLDFDFIKHSTIDSTVHAFEQFGALYTHNHGLDPGTSRLEPGTSRLQGQVDTNEPSGTVSWLFQALFSSHLSTILIKIYSYTHSLNRYYCYTLL